MTVDIHDLLPRKGPVRYNHYGSLVDEGEAAQNEDGSCGETEVVSFV